MTQSQKEIFKQYQQKYGNLLFEITSDTLDDWQNIVNPSGIGIPSKPIPCLWHHYENEKIGIADNFFIVSISFSFFGFILASST